MTATVTINAFDLATATSNTPPEVLRGINATVPDTEECRGIEWLDSAFRAVVFRNTTASSWADTCWVRDALSSSWASLNVRHNPCRGAPAGADCE